MRTSLGSRSVAALLAALFFGGAGGASDLDAVLFHRGGAPIAAGASHVEAAAAANCHAERCVLALRLANGRVAHGLAVPVRFEGIPQHDAGAKPASAQRRASANPQQQPRAPPASIA